MPENPITVLLPQDLPTNWAYGQTIGPNGTDVGLTQQHGYNYLMQQVNAAQQAASELGNGFSELSGDDIPAAAGSETSINGELSNKISPIALWTDAGKDLHGDARGIIAVNPAASGFGSLNAPTDVGWGVCLSLQYDNVRSLLLMDHRGLWLQNYNGVDWTSWAKFATATPPQVYDLSLADGFAAISPGRCTYYKTQEGIVHLMIGIKSNAVTGPNSQTVIGTLPAGFYPPVYACGAAGTNITDNSPVNFAGIVVAPDGNVWATSQVNWQYFYASITFQAA